MQRSGKALGYLLIGLKGNERISNLLINAFAPMRGGVNAPDDDFDTI
jgi:hypothetical protein